MSLLLKKQINKEISYMGLAGSVEGAAIQRLAEALQEEKRPDIIQQVLQICQSERNSGRVTAAQIDAALAQLKGGAQAMSMINVIDAFAVPKISYDPVGRKMFADTQPRHLFASAEAKQKLYLDRLQLIGQRMRRNRLFQQHNQLLSGSSEEPSAQLTDLQSLRGVLNQPRIVMGCITKAEDGRRFVLEDSSGSVPLDLSEAATTAGFFTENCVVVAEGELCHDGAFHVRALGFPPAETRSELPMASQRLNFFGGATFSREELMMMEVEGSAHMEDRIVVCANVWLDRPETFDALNLLFSGFQEAQMVPAMFVFMGNFHSRGGSGAVGRGPGGAPDAGSSTAGAGQGGSTGMSYTAIRIGFNKLALLVQQFPRIQNSSHFVFIPGPGDPCPGDVLPQPPLPSYFTEQLRAVLPKVSFASNPCRLCFYSQQVLFFRYDILKRMRRRCVIPPQGGESADADAMWGHLALTLLQQSHLCPLPLLQQPIYWEYDHAMHLYPLPHSVVVADTSPQAQHNHQGCSVFNPGSFADGFFAAYMPCKQVVEMSEMPRDGQLDVHEDEEDEEAGGGSEQQDEQQQQGQQEALEEGMQGQGSEGQNGGLSLGRGANSSDDESVGGMDAGERDDDYYDTLAHGFGRVGGASGRPQEPGGGQMEGSDRGEREQGLQGDGNGDGDGDDDLVMRDVDESRKQGLQGVNEVGEEAVGKEGSVGEDFEELGDTEVDAQGDQMG